MTKLTKTQTQILTAVLNAADEPAGASPRAIAGLVKEGLMTTSTKRKGATRFLLTEAGRAALGAPSASAPSKARKAKPAAAPAPKGKIAKLLELLGQPGGATVEAMMAATGWQAHSVRGALSGAIKKKLGLGVDSTKTETGRVYRLAGAEPAAGEAGAR